MDAINVHNAFSAAQTEESEFVKGANLDSMRKDAERLWPPIIGLHR